MPTQPQTLTEHYRAAQNAMQEGRFREAHQHCLAVLKIDQQHADAWFICGMIAANNGLLRKATEIHRKAIEFAPTNPEYRAELGKQLVALGELQQASQVAREALALNVSHLPTLNTLGTVLSHAGQHEEAVRCYRRAADLLEGKSASSDRPTRQWQADLFFNLGTSLAFAGQIQPAERAYEDAIQLNPEHFQAHAGLAQLSRQTTQANHLDRLLKLKTRAGSARERLHLGHALAKEQEDLDQLEEAMHSLSWAKAKQAEAVGYCAQEDANLFARVQTLFDRQFVASRQAADDACHCEEPIFIVGMPRTGTTLTERILAGHSRVYAAGELQNFPQQVKRMAATPSADLLDLETLAASVEINLKTLGQGYIDSTRPRTGHSDFFIDKLPLNFMYLGLIHLALPKAKLICLRRDPMDTCLSNYRQLFAPDFKYYYYSYDLLDCGRYYLQFDRLMRHWQEAMPGVVHEVHYEALVDNPEKVSRELLAFCDLDWEPTCLEFHKQQGSVATPSTAQVRQPIYDSSINRWQQYGEVMQPLYDMLSAAGCYPQAPD